jgi:bromodomain-containing protein 3
MRSYRNSSHTHLTSFNPNPNRNSANFYLIQNPSLRPPTPVFAQAAVENRRTVTPNEWKQYVTYNLNTCTTNDLKKLKKQLASELEAVRSLQSRIETRSGKKRAMPALPGRNIKKPAVSDSSRGKHVTSVMKKCRQLLTKIMKHKLAWVFLVPVDAVALRLSDYHQIIKNPMDLGTVKAKLDNYEYKSPLDFADDVRLTFKNALTYNDKGEDVHVMADALLLMFDQMFNPVYEKFEAEVRKSGIVHQKEIVGKVETEMIKNSATRVMTYSEKESLGGSLQNLQPDSIEQFLSIVRKGNCQVARDGDEIELDIEVMDDEILWELHKFVNSQKKTVVKKEEALVIDIPASPPEKYCL